MGILLLIVFLIATCWGLVIAMLNMWAATAYMDATLSFQKMQRKEGEQLLAKGYRREAIARAVGLHLFDKLYED